MTFKIFTSPKLNKNNALEVFFSCGKSLNPQDFHQTLPEGTFPWWLFWSTPSQMAICWLMKNFQWMSRTSFKEQSPLSAVLAIVPLVLLTQVVTASLFPMPLLHCEHWLACWMWKLTSLSSSTKNSEVSQMCCLFCCFLSWKSKLSHFQDCVGTKGDQVGWHKWVFASRSGVFVPFGVTMQEAKTLLSLSQFGVIMQETKCCLLWEKHCDRSKKNQPENDSCHETLLSWLPHSNKGVAWSQESFGIQSVHWEQSCIWRFSFWTQSSFVSDSFVKQQEVTERDCSSCM